MSLFIPLRSELVKIKGTSAWYLSLITALLTPLYSFLVDTQAHRIAALKRDPWNFYLMGMGGMAFNMLILPFYLVLTCTLLAQLEYRNNTWKQVYVSPQPLLHVFLSKFLIVQFLLIGVFILSNFLMAVSLFGIHCYKTNIDLFEQQLDWDAFFIFNGRIYITVLAISAFQFWLGLRFKNFIAPVVIGLCLWLMGIMMTEEYQWAQDDMFPYLYPMRNFFPKHPSERTTILWGSAIYTFLFLVLGFFNFKRRRNES